MAFTLTDDGTLDTVVKCDQCGEELRYTYTPDEPTERLSRDRDLTDDGKDYDAFVSWAIDDAEQTHECASDDDEPSEPDEDDITTQDHRTFYHYGRAVFEVAETVDGDYMLLVNGFQVGGSVDRSGAGDATYPTVEAAIRAYMERVQFWPDAWFISDHGNAHLIDVMERK